MPTRPCGACDGDGGLRPRNPRLHGPTYQRGPVKAETIRCLKRYVALQVDRVVRMETRILRGR